MGEEGRYSAGWKRIDVGTLPGPIRSAHDELSQFAAGEDLPVYLWNENHVAVGLTVDVELPTGGTVNDIDIRTREPLLFVFHLRHYPEEAPAAYSDRTDFPAEQLPHLNPTPAGHPSGLCLHRGSINEWFAEHSLTDFVERVRNEWLRDAAAGLLQRRDDFFEPTRMEEPRGIMVSDLALLNERVKRCCSFASERGGWAHFTGRLLKGSASLGWIEGKFAFQIDQVLPGMPSEQQIRDFRERNRSAKGDDAADRPLFGLLIWPPAAETGMYVGNLPDRFTGLAALAAKLQVPLIKALQAHHAVEADILAGIPVCLAILRPQPLIGTESRIEWLNFAIVAGEQHSDEYGMPMADAPVLPLGHRWPLTAALATRISGTDVTSVIKKIAIVGCGALGSKVSMHLAREGAVGQLLVDPKTLSPHNLARHGLLSGHAGQNKAEALKEEIDSLYSSEARPSEVEAIDGTALDLLQAAARLSECSHLLDASASGAVLNSIAGAEGIPTGTRVARCEITDEGRLGILSMEGKWRNPRIDDLQIALFDLGRTDRRISEWLARHRQQVEAGQGAVLEEIDIGLGCSSVTMQMPDDVISHHSAQVAMGLRRLSTADVPGGYLQISQLSTEGPIETATKTVQVRPVKILRSSDASGWSVRLWASAADELLMLVNRAGNKETGGLLMGVVQHKLKTICVTHVLPPSRDSEGSPYAFRRGILDYPPKMERVREQTGGRLWWAGEWHSHTNGDLGLSRKDRATADEIRKHLDRIRHPTHILVVTKKRMASHVFAP